MASDDEVEDAMTRARKAGEDQAKRKAEERERKKATAGHNISDMSNDDKRQLFKDARMGLVGGEPEQRELWKRFAQRVEIGVFLTFWKRHKECPTDADLARLWPGWPWGTE